MVKCQSRKETSTVPLRPRTDDSKILTSAVVPGPYWHGCDQTVRMLNVYHFVYRQYGFEFLPSHEDLIFYEWLGATNRLAKFLKWRTANILARAVRSLEMVPNPFSMESIPRMFDYYFEDSRMGLLRTDQGFHRMKLARRSRKRYAAFCFALYQSKSASLPASPWEIREAELGTHDRITTDKTIPGPIWVPSGYLEEDDLLRELDRTVDEVFPRQPERPAPRRLPSRSATLFSRRVDGGAMSDLVASLGYGFRPYEFLVSFFEGPRGAVPVYSLWSHDDIQYIYDHAKLCSRNYHLFPDFYPAIDNVILCSPVGLVEPFKVRVITKAAGHHYLVAREYQPRFWRTLREHPIFRLIGEPLTSPVLRQLCNQIDPEKDNWLISGDYAQATDHIPSHLGNRVLERMAWRCGVPAEDVPTLLASLTGHMISDRPYDRRGTNVFTRQLSGQLMGSPASFPVLCIYNAALTRLAFENAHRRRTRMDLADIPMLVNGDDLLLVADLSTYQTWKRVVDWGGLIPSVGKTLVSKEFGTINSQLWKFENRESFGARWTEPVHVPHCALQLALGSMKSGHADSSGFEASERSPRADSKMWREFLDSCPDRERGWRFLWSANRNLIHSLTRAFPTSPLCLPVEAGGLGFPLPPSTSEFYSPRAPRRAHLLAARMLLEEGTLGHHELRDRWTRMLSALDWKPSESLWFARQAAWQRTVGCPLLCRPVSDDPPLDSVRPPPLLNMDFAETPRVDRDVHDDRRSLHFRLLREVRNYSRSGRGPWSVAEVESFLRSHRWERMYGRYSSDLRL